LIYWLLKHIFLGPLLRLAYRPKAKGLANVPTEGPVILASNHLSFVDSLFIPLMIKRKVVFLGKSDYFDSKKTRWFFRSVNVIPVRREGGTAGEASIRAGVQALKDGNVVGIYPEGTRSPDGRLYRGKTGVARMALLAGAKVVPVAVHGTDDIMPLDKKTPKLHGRVVVEFGRALSWERYEGQASDRFVLRSATDEIMYEIMLLSNQEYVDEYASKVKAQMAERKAGDADEGGSVQADVSIEIPDVEAPRK
jgi:1-acyl-sn-glycerol-3-phosphate acyltransferase